MFWLLLNSFWSVRGIARQFVVLLGFLAHKKALVLGLLESGCSGDVAFIWD